MTIGTAITWYRVRCDSCSKVGPKSPVQEEAISHAIQENWRHVTWWTGLEYVQKDFCPDCLEKSEQPRAEQFREEPEEQAKLQEG